MPKEKDDPPKPPTPPETPADGLDDDEREVFNYYKLDKDEDRAHVRKLAAARDLAHLRRKRRETPANPKPEEKKTPGWNPIKDGD